MLKWRIQAGDHVVLLDQRGRAAKGRDGRPLRGQVVYATLGSCTVLLASSRELAVVSRSHLRLAPQLAYVRPRSGTSSAPPPAGAA